MANKDVWKIFSDECPGVAAAYQKLFNEMNFDDALDDKTRALVLVGINSATMDPLSTRFWVRQALRLGVSRREVEAAALLAWCRGVSSAEMSIPIIIDAAEEMGK